MSSTRVGEKLLAINKYQILSELMCDYAASYHFTSDDNDQARLEWVVGAFEEITGHPIPNAWTNFSLSAPIHPDDLKAFQARQARLRAGEASVAEFRIINKNGEVRWLLSRGLPEWNDERQEVTRVYVGVQDITERKQAEENLRISEIKYRHLLETSIQGIVLLQDGRFVYCNPSMSKITGYSVDEMLAMSSEQVANLVHPDDRPGVQSNIRQRLAGTLTEQQYEHRIIRAGGEIRHVEIYATLTTYQDKPAIQGTYIDITEKKQVQEAYKALVDNALQGFLIFQDGRVVFANAMTSAIIGYSNAELRALEDPISSIVHPDSKATARIEVEKLFNGEYISDYELCIITRQEEERWLHSIGTLINYRGRPAIQASIVDITKQRQLEKELAHAAAIIQSSDDAIIGEDIEGIVLSWNPGAERIYGYKAAEVIGKPLTILIPPDFPNDVPAILERIRRGESVDHYETVRMAKDGRQLNISLTISPIRDEKNQITGASIIARDITASKKIEQTLRESEGRLMQAMSAARLGIWEWNIETDETVWMGEMFRMYGISPEEFTGKGADYLNFTQPEDRQMQQENIARAFENGLTEKDLIENRVEITYRPNYFRILRPDGSICYVQGDAIAIVDDDGKPLRMIGLLQDITEQRNFEKAMQQAQKLESLGVLAGSVAHDFNNLLTGILFHASIIKSKIGPDSAFDKNLQAIIETAERAADITNQLLAYTGKGRFNITQFSLNELIQKNISLLQATLPKNIALNFEAEKDLPRLTGDMGQIQQVIMNLIINASDAYNGRSGLVKLKTETCHVSGADIRKWENFGHELQPGPYLSLTVTDWGQGMDNPTLARIFDPFFTTKETGRGLGLAAVQGIIRGHQGALRVSSHVEEGTTFQILFPIKEAEPAEKVIETPITAVDAENQLVLIVDDEEAIRMAAGETLEDYGYRILLAPNGYEAIDICRQYHDQITLILLDMTMPGLSGQETLAALIENGLIFPTVFMSGYNEQAFNANRQPENVVGFLKKPFLIEMLLDTIASAVAK